MGTSLMLRPMLIRVLTFARAFLLVPVQALAQGLPHFLRALECPRPGLGRIEFPDPLPLLLPLVRLTPCVRWPNALSQRFSCHTRTTRTRVSPGIVETWTQACKARNGKTRPLALTVVPRPQPQPTGRCWGLIPTTRPTLELLLAPLLHRPTISSGVLTR